MKEDAGRGEGPRKKNTNKNLLQRYKFYAKQMKGSDKRLVNWLYSKIRY